MDSKSSFRFSMRKNLSPGSSTLFSRVLVVVAFTTQCFVGCTAQSQLSLNLNGVTHKLEPKSIAPEQVGSLGSYELSNGGSDITLYSNTLAVFEAPAYKMQDTTILEFDFSVREEAVMHAICLRSVLDEESDIYRGQGQLVMKRCFRLSGTIIDNLSPNKAGFVLEKTTDGSAKSYRVQVGHFLQTWLRNIVFISVSPRKNLGDVTFSNIRVFENPSPVRLTLKIQGSTTTVDGAPKSYGPKGLDVSGTNSYSIFNGGDKLVLRGNAWKAFPLDKYIVTENTFLKFSFSLQEEVDMHAVCLVDEVSPIVFSGTGCFRLAGIEQPGTPVLGIPLDLTSEGSTKEYEVNVGKHFVGDVTHVVFISDSQIDRSKGKAVFENIELYDIMPNLFVTLNNEVTEVGDPLSTQDIIRESTDAMGQFSVTDNGEEITLYGHTSNTFPIPIYEVKDNTILTFDFSVLSEAGAHAICLDEPAAGNSDIEHATRGYCFYLAGTMDSDAIGNKDRNYFLVSTTEGGSHRYRIELGHYFTGEINYIRFLSTAESTPTLGTVSFHAIELFENASALRLSVQSNGNIRKLKRPTSYGDSGNFKDDSGVNQYEISPDLTAITLRGNAWKAFPLNYLVRPSTILSFDFTLFEETRVHAICLDNDLEHTTIQRVKTEGNVRTEERVVDKCFWIAGYGTRCSSRTVDNGTNDLLRSTCWPFQATSGFTQLAGEVVHYRIPVGDFFTGRVGYIVLINDAKRVNKAEGEATFSNIRIMNEP